MLINTNIKNILGGGCKIKEVRYMNNIVWKKQEEYLVKISIYKEADEVLENMIIYINREDLSYAQYNDFDYNTKVYSYEYKTENAGLSLSMQNSRGSFEYRIIVNGSIFKSENVSRFNLKEVYLPFTSQENQIQIYIKKLD